jgi:hypothetical protein
MRIKREQIVGFTLAFNNTVTVMDLQEVYPEMGLTTVRVAMSEETGEFETVAHGGLFALVALTATDGEVCILSGIVKGIVREKLTQRHKDNIAKYGDVLMAGPLPDAFIGAYEGAKLAEKYVPETHPELIMEEDGSLTFIVYGPKGWDFEKVKKITEARVYFGNLTN